MIDWLKKRLSPVKRNTARWTELAEALQSFWEENFDPNYDAAAALRSIYEADAEGQKLILKEMGPYFEDTMPDSSLPVSVALRKLELHQKETDVPLKSALKRLGITVNWQPLYMLPDSDYGDAFYTDDQLLESNIAECLLTSRGVLVIDISKEPVSEEMAALAIRRCRQILPLHIVFDRCRLFYTSEKIRNIPRIAISDISSEMVITYPYKPSTLSVSATNTTMRSGSINVETIEIRPQ